MFESEFYGFSPHRAYQGAKCVNHECEQAHVVIKIDQTHRPKCSVVKIDSQKGE